MNKQSIVEYSQIARRLISQKMWNQLFGLAQEIQNKFSQSSEGYFLTGLAAKKLGQATLAQKQFEDSLALDVQRYDAAVELAELLLIQCKFNECYLYLQKYQNKLKNSSYYLLEAARLFRQLGLHDRAWPLLERANVIQPNIDAIVNNLAECSVLLGKTDLADSLYKKLIAKNPSVQRNHYEYSKIKRVSGNDHIAQMETLLKSNSQDPKRNIYLYYALGKELEDLERWSEAFIYYEKAGKAVLESSNYSVNDDLTTIETIINTCDQNWLNNSNECEDLQSQQKTPIFIVGLPRTGTTLIERVISSHSRVESADETFLFPLALNMQRGISRVPEIDASFIEEVASSNLNRVASSYIELIDYKLTGNDYFIDKYPFNFLLLGFIAKAFPKAKLIYLDRQPLDACFAMFKQSYFKFSYSLNDLGKYYLAHNKLKQHWIKLLGDRLIKVSYETFVCAQESTTRRLLAQIGVEFEDSCLNFHNNPLASATASTLQVREKVYTRSVNKWKNFESQLTPLREYFIEQGMFQNNIID